MSKAPNNWNFISGRSKLGGFYKTFRWDETSLGDVNEWPVSLRSTISLITENPLPMCVFWGSDFIQLYNDSYGEMLGEASHSKAFGKSAHLTYGVKWPELASIFHTVLNGHSFRNADSVMSSRNGYLSEHFYDFYYSSLRDLDGTYMGILSTAVEITDKKMVEEKYLESKDLLHFALDAVNLGTWDYNPTSGEFNGNNNLKSWFGVAADEKIKLEIVEDAIIHEDQVRVNTAIHYAMTHESGGKYAIDYTIVNPITGERKIVHAKGKAWFTEDKVCHRLTGTLEDVTLRILAKRKSMDDEQLIQHVVLEAPVGICVMEAQTKIIEIVNQRFSQIIGVPVSKIVNKPFSEGFTGMKFDFEDELEQVIESGQPYFAREVELELNHGEENKTVFVTLVFSPLKNELGLVSKIAVWFVDNTILVKATQKVVESEYNLSLMILQAPIAIAILKGNDYKVEIANANLLELWGKTEQQIVNYSIFDAMPELNTQGMKRLLEHVTMTGKRFSASEYPMKVIRDGMEQTVYINFSFDPLFDSKNSENGIMAIGVDVSQQVRDRKEIEEREQSIRSIVENAPFPIGVYEGEDLIITVANQSIMDVWGKGNDVIGKSYKAILPELENQEIFDQVHNVFTTGIHFHAKNQRVNIEIGGKLQPFYFNYSFLPLYNTMGQVYGVMNTAADVTDIHLARIKIEDSEKRFRESVQQAPLGITILRGNNYMVEMANENYLLLVDRSAESFIGKPIFESLPEVRETIESIFQNIMNTGIPFYGNEFPATLNRYGKNELTFFNFVYHPLKEENDEITGIMVVATEVTSTVKAKHLLQESEKHFRNMVMQSPVPMTILRGDNYIIESANKAMLETVWFKKSADVIGIPILEVFPELNHQKYASLLDQVYTSGKTHSEKESVAFFAGDEGVKKFFMDFEYAPLYDTEGAISGIMTTVNDVTDKVEARLKVEKNEERLNIVVDSSELGVWEYNLKNKDIQVSDRCKKILGYPATTDVSASELIERFKPDDIKMIERCFKESFISGTLFYESSFLWEDCSIHSIEVRGKVFYDKKCQPDRMIGTMRDVTKEKNFQNLLVEREEKFRLLADSMPQFVWTSDNNGILNYYNKSVYLYSGLTYDEISGEGWIRMVHPEDRERNIKRWKHSISTGENFHLEHRFQKADGNYRWQLSRAIPQKDEYGTIKMWVGSSTDIQDQKLFTEELENQVIDRTKELNLKNIDLEKMNKELQSFAYISSHDLQEPLRKIQTFSSMLVEDEYPNMTDRGRDMFGRMQNAAKRMQTLIQDLLSYSRTNSQDRVFAEVSFLAIIEELKDDLEEEFKQKEAVLEANCTGKLRVIPFQFRQLLSNLISNALKFSDPSRPLLIKIESREITGSASGNSDLAAQKLYNHIKIADNGIGFDSAYSEKIFDVFQRLHSKADYAGTGIGLAIVKKIVDNHDGFIRASGELKKGATFDIYIPA